MEKIEVKRQLLEEALDHLKNAQLDFYVLSTEIIIKELEAVLRQPDVISAVCKCESDYVCGICYKQKGYKVVEGKLQTDL